MTFDPPVATQQPDGVHLNPASHPYVEVEALGAKSAAGVIRAPAHVAFQDGAVAEVSPPMAGRVVTIHVKVGDTVKVGDPLVTLSSPDAAAARASLGTAIAAEREALDVVARQKQMAEQGVGVQSEKIAADARLAEAQAEVARARATAAYLGDGYGPVVVVRAPIQGTVLARKATVGANYQPGDPVLEIGNPSALWIVADVFERDLAQVKEKAAVDVTLETVSSAVPGHVISVGSVLNAALRTAPVYIALDDPKLVLRPGMYARATIKAEASGQLTLPVSAVLIKDGKRMIVYVKKGEDLFEARDVVVGPTIEGRVAVISGVGAGDQVAVKGALLLDGAAEQLL